MLAFQAALAGRYSIEHELGRGGMGIVYLAREVRLDRLVALKLLPPHLAALPPLKERFLHEARTAAGLSHPNVVPIYAVDEVGGFVFFAMAYVRGETLARRIAKGRLAPAEASRLLREVAWALAYAHAQGVVHRDVKPDNILIEEGTGRALVADFGIARVAAGGGTAVGEVLGTPEYMSPEQAAAEPLDGRSDLYSLGAVAYAALSGRPPFESPSAAALLAKHLTEAPVPLAAAARGVPAPLCRAVDRCLAKQPADRFSTGEELAEALADAMETQRELPVGIRVFLRKIGREQSAVIGLAAVMVFMALPSFTVMAVQTGGALAGIATVLGYFGVFAVAYLFTVVPKLRKLLRLGYSGADVESAVAIELKRRREELEFEYGPRPVKYLNWISGAGIAMGGAGLVAAVAGAGEKGGLAVLGGVLIWYLGFRRAAEQRDFNAEMRARFWGSRFAKWLFRLAGIGTGAAPQAAVNRPTELAIGSAAEVLFAALPREVRRGLGDVPATLRRLEQHAQTVRKRIEELEASLADAERGAKASVAAPQRNALLEELRAARDAAQERLSAVVAILETIRLDLVRLRAGAGTLAGITEDLTKAREIGEGADRLIAARAEVEAVLKA